MKTTLPLINNKIDNSILPDPKTITSGNYFTTARITKIALGTLASSSGITAVTLTALACAGVIGSAGFAAIPLAIIAGVAIWQISRTTDYDDPKELESYRKECKELSLEKCLEKHSNKLFTKQLLSQEDFETKYTDAESQYQTLPTIASYYQKIEALTRGTGYKVPYPARHLEGFQRKCETLSLDAILKTHGASYLFDWQLLSPDLFTQKYLDKETACNGLLEIQALYQEMENAKTNSCNYTVYTVPHYNRLIENIQQECENLSLNEIIHQHGFSNLFSLQLLTPPSFTEKYQQHVTLLFKEKGIDAVLSTFEQAQKALLTAKKSGNFEIPHPSYLSKSYLEQIKSKSFLEIEKNFDLNQLIRHGILPDGPYQTLLVSLKNQKEVIDRNYTKSTNHARSACEQRKDNEKNQLKTLEKNINASLTRINNDQKTTEEEKKNLLTLLKQPNLSEENRKMLADMLENKYKKLQKGESEKNNLITSLTKAQDNHEVAISQADKDYQGALAQAFLLQREGYLRLDTEHATIRNSLILQSNYYPA